MKQKSKGFSLNPIKSDTKTIVKSYKIPLCLISILMGVLLFILNVFLSGAFFGNTFNEAMKDKLGIYIYLNDVITSEKDILEIKDSLEEKGLKVNYTSKKDALGFVEKRVPELTTTFKKYNLSNPLPSTLYIRYADQAQFNDLKEILEINKDKILNISDVSDNAIKTQEKRVLNIINLSNFIQGFAYLVVIAILLTIIAFAIFFLRTIFSHFNGDIQAKKLLGANAAQIIQPFVNAIFISLVAAFITAIILFISSLFPLNSYLSAVTELNIFEYLSTQTLKIIGIGAIEIIVITALLMGISYRYIYKLHNKLK